VPEWKDDVSELTRRWWGIIPSSGLVGCQSIGCNRASNLAERPSFHLRNTVQRIATPPIHDATMISTVNAVLLVFAAALTASAEALAEDAVTDAVRVTVGFPEFVAVSSAAALRLRVSDV
jgi:glycerol-3-phosphate O-acyltransferase